MSGMAQFCTACQDSWRQPKQKPVLKAEKAQHEEAQ